MIMKKNLLTATKMGLILAALGLLTACRGEKTGTASTSEYDTNTAVSTEIEYLGTEEYEITGNRRPALTDAEKQEKYRRYLKEVLSNR